MIQNKLKEAYPTPLQLRNATKELQNNAEFEKEILINLDFDLNNNYTSPDESIVYTTENHTIIFNLDKLCKKNQLNCLNIFSNQVGTYDEIIYEFYSKDYSYNFIVMNIFENNENITVNNFTISIRQENAHSIYLVEDYVEQNNFSIDEGYVEITYSNKNNLWIENKYLGKATGYSKDGLCCLNKVIISFYRLAV